PLFPGITTAEAGGVGDAIAKLLVFGVKMALFIAFYMFIRWTIPRFRFDQLMGLAWKVMMPLALVNLLVVLMVKHFDLSHWWMLVGSLISIVAAAWVSLLMPRAPERAPLAVRGHPVTGKTRILPPVS